MRVRVVFGVCVQSDFMCGRCRGGGAEPGNTAVGCTFCGGAGVLPPWHTWTYEAPEDAQLWNIYLTPDEVPQTVTVVALGSHWGGEVKTLCGTGTPLPADIALPIVNGWPLQPAPEWTL